MHAKLNETTCRTCMIKIDTTDEKHPIAEEFNDEETLAKFLEIHTKIQIEINDALPQNVCENCFRVLSAIQKFITKTQDCDKLFHQLIVDESETRKVPKFRCQYCNKKFPAKSKLEEHVRTHTKEKPFKCSQCSATFSINVNLKRHEMIHTGEKPHICEMCGKGFIQLVSLKKHLLSHTNEMSHVCSFCGKAFKQEEYYKLHVEKYHKNPTYRSDCKQCNRKFLSKNSLRYHMLYHGEKRFRCGICYKTFHASNALTVHLRIHTGEKPFKCDLCYRTFSQKGALKIHKYTHTGTKPYRCNVCGKKFSQLSHLKYHLLVHTGQKPHSCGFCNKSFSLKYNLVVHIRTHTGETPFICFNCGKGFHESTSYKKHRKTVKCGNSQY